MAVYLGMHHMISAHKKNASIDPFLRGGPGPFDAWGRVSASGEPHSCIPARGGHSGGYRVRRARIKGWGKGDDEGPYPVVKIRACPDEFRSTQSCSKMIGFQNALLSPETSKVILNR